MYLVFRRVQKIVKSDNLLCHVCQSICLHGTTWLPLGGLS